MKIKLALIAFVFATVFACSAQASSIVITLDHTSLSGRPGDTLAFFGTITNTSGIGTYDLNNVDFNLTGGSFSVDYIDPFFNNVPLSLAPHSSSGEIELFDVTLLNPFTDPMGSYGGTYTLKGGIEINGPDTSADVILAQANFTVTAVPEPASVLLLFSGLAALALIMRWRTKGTHITIAGRSFSFGQSATHQ